MPQQAPIRLFPNEEPGLEVLAGAQPSAHNVVMDRRGAVRKRPGIAQLGQLTEPLADGAITGLHVDVAGRVWAAVTDNAGAWVYRVSESGAFLSAGFMVGSDRVQWAETQAMVVAAAGNKPWRSDLEIPAMIELPGNPPQATHIVAQASRLVAMGQTPDANSVNYSDIATGAITDGHELWNGDDGSDSGPLPVNARPDYNKAMHDNTNELFVWGSSTLQVFAPDPTTTYAPVSTRELGLLAAYSVVKDDQAFSWLDNYRRIVTSDGRTFQVLSDPIKLALEGLAHPEEGFGYRCLAGPTDALVWTFPGDWRTFVYYKNGAWSEWSSWSTASGNWTKFKVTAAAQDNINGRTVVGLEDGRLGVITHDAQDDLGDEFNAFIESGFEDRGTSNRKHCQQIALTLRRGLDRPIDEVPVLRVEWRDDEGPWSDPLLTNLGALPDREIVVRYHSLGFYRRRQWRFSFLSGDPVALVRVDETFEVMGI
jgi:hypothetical protein